MNEPTIKECPICRKPLEIQYRQGIEIDFCPLCHGVWLDREELDKIIERTTPRGLEKAQQQQMLGDLFEWH